MDSRFSVFSLVVSLVTGCAPRAEGPTLTRLSEIASSAKCRSGGVLISTGRDWNRDGTLADDEVIQTSEVCNGVTPANGTNGVDGKNGTDGAAGRDGTNGLDGVNGVNAPTPLTRTTMLPAGDLNCPSGGVRLEVGLDQPLDGGLGDGVLDPAELQSTRYLCNGTTPVYLRPTTPPGGASGTSTLSASGGVGSRSGGNAGAITVQLTNGSLGGNVKVFGTGQVDAGFAWPVSTFEPGARPLRVATDLTVRMYGSVAAGLQSSDTHFALPLSGVIYAKVGSAAEAVTSIDVEAGATLVVPAAMGQVTVKGDIRNAGLIRGDAVSDPRVELSSLSFWGLRGSSVVSSGRVVIQAHRIVNEGTLDVHGEAGAQGGRVYLQGHECVNAGLLDARGGHGATTAGSGGRIELTCGEILNRGAMQASAGDGATGFNRGGQILFKTFGDLFNSGELSARGGACSGAGCLGASGGLIRLVAAGNLRNNARLSATGGWAGSGTGGTGGSIDLMVQPTLLPRVVGSLFVSGSMSVSGGEGFAGGSGGAITIALDPSASQAGQEVELLGYAEFVAAGGHAGSFGGMGGPVIIKAMASSRGGSVIGPTGATVVTAERIDVHGGSASVSGRAGLISLGTSSGEVGAPGEFVLNLAALNGNGGSGNHVGGAGATVELVSAGSVENRGKLMLRGGNGPDELGGLGGSLWMLASNTVVNSGSIDVSGGDSFTELGGRGGQLSMLAGQATNSGALMSNGGFSDNLGGNGGQIQLFSCNGITKNTGSVETKPGPLAQPGSVMLDGIKQ